MLARAKLGDINQWAENENFEWKEPGRARGDFVSSSHLAEYWYSATPEPELPIEPCVSDGLAGRYHPPFAFLSEALEFGHNSCLHATRTSFRGVSDGGIGRDG